MKMNVVAIAMMTTLLAGASPLLAVEAVIDNHGGSPMKDECLLLARNCGTETYTTQERIERLMIEIHKGNSVYTPDELNRLKEQLRDYYRSPGNKNGEKGGAS